VRDEDRPRMVRDERYPRSTPVVPLSELTGDLTYEDVTAAFELSPAPHEHAGGAPRDDPSSN
jgi:hypothetical protein